MIALDRSQPPLPDAGLSDFRFPDFSYQRVGEGLEIYAARWGSAPLVSLEVILPGGGQRAPSDSPGLASFAASLLDEGTERNTGVEIARRMETLGGSLGSGADWDSASVSAVCLTKDTETALELISDVSLRPNFPEEAITREGARRLAEIRRRQAQPSHLANRALLSTIYGETPYGQPLIGTQESLQSFDRDRITAFFDQVMRGPLQIIAVGDLDPALMIETIQSWFPTVAPRPAQAPPAITPPRSIQEPRVLIVDRPAGSQTELRMGHVGVPRLYPERTALGVMESLLGGKFTSRINLNLRERHGYTYGARASFSARRGPGPLIVSAAVETPSAGAAAREVIYELERIRETPVQTTELEDTIGYLLGVFPYTLQGSSGVASRLAGMAIHGLPHDYYRELPSRLESVTVDDIQRVARATLDPQGLTIVAVGPAAELQNQFANVGSIEVIEG